MNKENLLRMAEYLRAIPKSRFSMRSYRTKVDDWNTQLCGSVGCVIGHCTTLDKWDNIPRDNFGNILFATWSEKFTGLKLDTPEWWWLFGSYWAMSDNTPTGAAKRIHHLINHGLPENWEQQMMGDAPLSY